MPPPTISRIAIYPIENLTSRAELAGAARALPLLIEYQLSGLKDMGPVLVTSPSDAAAKRATRELRGYFEANGAALSVKLQDRSAGGKIERVIEARGTDLGKISDAIAKQVSSSARALPSASSEALNAFAAGLAALGSPASIDLFTQATKLAPEFGPAWLQLGAALTNAGNSQQGLLAWQAALGHKIDPISLARIRVELAARGHAPVFAQTLADLARLLPADGEAQFRAGNALSDTARFPESASFLQAAVTAEPANAIYRNALAYSQAMSRDFEAALATIETYIQLQPNAADPLDSKGEIQFYAHHFADAGRTFETISKADPNFQQGFFWRKAGEAYLLAGDSVNADRVMGAWTNTLPPNGPLRERFTAVWEHRTGKPKEAIERMVRIAAVDPLALTQSIVWLVQAGDRARAAEMAARVQGPSMTLLKFLASPSASAEVWTQRAQVFANPQAARTALTYALALDNHWAEVAALLAPDAPILNSLKTSQELALYRRALTETKKADELKKLPDFPMIPTQGSDSLFDCLIYVK